MLRLLHSDPFPLKAEQPRPTTRIIRAVSEHAAVPARRHVALDTSKMTDVCCPGPCSGILIIEPFHPYLLNFLCSSGPTSTATVATAVTGGGHSGVFLSFLALYLVLLLYIYIYIYTQKMTVLTQVWSSGLLCSSAQLVARLALIRSRGNIGRSHGSWRGELLNCSLAPTSSLTFSF